MIHLAIKKGTGRLSAGTVTVLETVSRPDLVDLHPLGERVEHPVSSEAPRPAGGDLFTAFNSIMRYSGTGRWGVLEYQTQPRLEAPKYDALMQFIEM